MTTWLLATASTTTNGSVNWGDVPGWITAGAAVVALIFAALAAKAAFAQAREARSLREEQAAPYVIVDVEPSEASSMYLELYVKNIGQTVARNVQVTFDPPLKSTLDDETSPRASAGFLSRPIGAMPPGREYRMLFDSGPALHDSDLPREYRATVMFDGVHGPQTLVYEIDVNVFYDYDNFEIYGMHDVAKHMKDMLAQMEKWKSL
jgi:hypothetical protein